MATHPYKNVAGYRVPGVTTVIGGNLGWSKDALMAWANREGLAGRNIRDRESKSAAETGTAAHAMIEALTHDRDVWAVPELTGLTPAERDQARQALESFVRWQKQTGLVIAATEVFGVNEELQTGFCIDALAVADGRLTLADYKSGKAIYAEAIIQVAAYVELTEVLLREGGWLGPDDCLDGAHILRVAGGNFTHIFRTRESLREAWDVFKCLRTLHQARKGIESLTK